MKRSIQIPLEDIKKFDLVTQELPSLCFHEELAATKQRVHRMSLAGEY